MDVEVEALGGSVLNLNLPAASTIDDLYACVAVLQGTEPQLLPLTADGAVLEYDPRGAASKRFLSSHNVGNKSKIRQGFPRRNFRLAEGDYDYGMKVAAAYAWVCEAQDCGMKGSAQLEESMARLVVDAALEPDTLLLVDSEEIGSNYTLPLDNSSPQASTLSLQTLATSGVAVSSRASPASRNRRSAPLDSVPFSPSPHRRDAAQHRRDAFTDPVHSHLNRMQAYLHRTHGHAGWEFFVHSQVLGRSSKHFHWRRIVLNFHWRHQVLAPQEYSGELWCSSATRARLDALDWRLDALKTGRESSTKNGSRSQCNVVHWLEVAAVIQQDLVASPDDADAWFNLGMAFFSNWELEEQAGDLRAAAWALRCSLELTHRDPEVLQQLRIVLQHLGPDHEVAEEHDLEILQRQHQSDPDNVEIILALGAACLWQWRRSDTNFKDAIRLFDECLALFEEGTVEREAAQVMRALASFAALGGSTGAYQHLDWHEWETELVRQTVQQAADPNAMLHGLASKRRIRAMRRAWLKTASAQKGDAYRCFPVVLRVGAELDGTHLSLPEVCQEHVTDMLHILYTSAEEIGHKGDSLVSLLHCCLCCDARDGGTMARLHRALLVSPSLTCLELAERYDYCRMPRERWMEDLRAYMVHTLSHFDGEHLKLFRGWAAPDQTTVAIKDSTKLEILERRIRALEHTFHYSKAASSRKTHSRKSGSGGQALQQGGSHAALARKLFRDREGIRMMKR